MIRLALALLLASPVSAATVAVTPASVTAAIAAAKPGDVLRLSGDFARITIKGRAYSPPLAIDATAATVRGVTLDTVDGVSWTGGRITGNGASDLTGSVYGMGVTNSHNIAVAGVDVTGWARGVVIGSSTDVAVTGSWFHALRTDGVDVALSQRVRVAGNLCSDFRPNATDHPDCQQAWSRPGGITSDLTITGNVAVGMNMQCFSGFNHPERLPIGDPGFDRVTVTGNLCRNGMPQGISWSDCRDCVVTGNDVQALPGAVYKTQVNFVRSTGSACGNVVAGQPKAVVAAACKP